MFVVKAVLLDLGTWFWRLLPANPILVRVVSGGSRRVRHLQIRAAYLAVLLVVVLIWQIGQGGGQASLAEHAKNATQVFEKIAYVQLAMMCFLAPVFTAGAITQERDAETFNVLLTTPLSNAQIVFGSLLSRLFFVIVLLLAGLPIFCITMLYGGVTGREIFLSFGIAATTAVLTGSLAIVISMMRSGTRRTIFSFYLSIATYLMIVLALGLWWRGSWIPEAPATSTTWAMSWLTPLHPFLAMMAAMGKMNVPTAASLAGRSAISRWALSQPHTAYMAWTLLSSLVLVAMSTFSVRAGAKEGENTLFNRLRQVVTRRLGGDGSGEKRRKPRHVWRNPVAWREATTRASAASQGIMRYFFVLGGLIVAFVLWLYYINGWDGVNAAFARDWLGALVLIEFVMMLLLATNTAATAISREREANTMELLLTTPLTSDYIVWGKLRGLVSFTVPLIVVPWLSVALFVAYDLLRGTQAPVVYPEALLLLPGLMLIYSALACMLGLQTSLKSRRTVQAVLMSVGILVVLGFGAGACGVLFTSNANDTVGPFVAPFTMVIAIATVVNPELTLQTSDPAILSAARATMFIGSLVSIAVYAVVVRFIYRGLVRNFDMTLRKQSQ